MTKKRDKYYFWMIVGVLSVLAGMATFAPGVNGAPDPRLIINEFMTDNRTILADEDGDFSDWIEIYNSGDTPANLSGWSLTDDPDDPEKWTFPDWTLASHGYLVVFASGKDRKPGQGQASLHTNFRLNHQAEFLGLFNTFDEQFIDSLSYEFPEQNCDISYGRWAEDRFGYFKVPSPGKMNDVMQMVGEELLSPVQFSVPRGFYDEPFELVLSTGNQAAIIQYTTDGSLPTLDHGQTYTGPILIHTTTSVRAAAFKEGYVTSPILTNTYIFLKDVLYQPANPAGFPQNWGVCSEDMKDCEKGEIVKADYAMDPEIVNDPRHNAGLKEGLKTIPTISLVMDAASFSELYTNPRQRGKEWERPVSAEFIYPGHPGEDFQIDAGLRIHGHAGRMENVPKHSFRLFFRKEYGQPKLEYLIFPDSHVKSFNTLVLRAGADRSYAGLPDGWRYNRSATYTRDEWLRESQIAMSGIGSHGVFVHLYVNNLYWGLYNLVERPDEAFASSYFGGNEDEWLVMNEGAMVHGELDTARQLLEFSQISDPDQRFLAIASNVDITRFCDYVILNWYAGTRDWPQHNWYASIMGLSGKLRFFVWDGERSWTKGGSVWLGDDNKNAWPWPNVIKPLFDTLMFDPDFRMILADRIALHLTNNGALSQTLAMARWQKLCDLVEQPIVAETARWGDAREESPLTQKDWRSARDDVLKQMEGNAPILIQQAREAGYYPSIDPPRLEQLPGSQPDSLIVSISATTGTIFYTLDGTDPRAPGGRSPNSGAMEYHSPISVSASTPIKARARHAGEWSPLSEVRVSVPASAENLVVSELMYHPTGGEDYEFIELTVVGELPVEVANARFDHGFSYVFPSDTSPLKPGESLVLCSNREKFEQRYPGIKVSGEYAGNLANNGERISLSSDTGQEIFTFAYDDERGWPVSPDGKGDSLVLRRGKTNLGDAGNWRASTQINGSPGTNDPY